MCTTQNQTSSIPTHLFSPLSVPFFSCFSLLSPPELVWKKTTMRSYGAREQARRTESQTQLSPTRTVLTKDVVAASLCRMNRPHELLDSPRSKSSRWPGDDADVPMPNWSVLLHDEIYKQEIETKLEITRRYNAFLKKPLRMAGGGKGAGEEGAAGDGATGAVGAEDDAEQPLALDGPPTSSSSQKKSTDDAADDPDAPDDGGGDADGSPTTAPSKSSGSAKKSGQSNSQNTSARRSIRRDSRT